jgi:phosphatidylinositol alpha-1,6-mannosyltransferase
VVAGGGPLKPSLEQQVSDSGLDDAVRFVGRIPDSEREHWLERAHVFAMPSRVPDEGTGGEGFGIVYLEAASHGLPVVAGDVAGARDAVANGETGILVDPADHVAVAGAISELLLDPARAAELGRAGAERARRFSWPAHAQAVRELILNATNAKR